MYIQSHRSLSFYFIRLIFILYGEGGRRLEISMLLLASILLSIVDRRKEIRLWADVLCASECRVVELMELRLPTASHDASRHL